MKPEERRDTAILFAGLIAGGILGLLVGIAITTALP